MLLVTTVLDVDVTSSLNTSSTDTRAKRLAHCMEAELELRHSVTSEHEPEPGKQQTTGSLNFNSIKS